jgi:imidazolonepropionase-like amidohydrolase
LNEEEQRKLLVDPRYFKEMFPNVVENIKKLNGMGAKIGIGTDVEHSGVCLVVIVTS